MRPERLRAILVDGARLVIVRCLDATIGAAFDGNDATQAAGTLRPAALWTNRRAYDGVPVEALTARRNTRGGGTLGIDGRVALESGSIAAAPRHTREQSDHGGEADRERDWMGHELPAVARVRRAVRTGIVGDAALPDEAAVDHGGDVVRREVEARPGATARGACIGRVVQRASVGWQRECGEAASARVAANQDARAGTSAGNTPPAFPAGMPPGPQRGPR